MTVKTSKTPLPTVKPYHPGPEYDGMTNTQVRKAAPFQPGDVIYVEREAKVKKPDGSGFVWKSVARIAKVMNVHTHYSFLELHWFPVYRCVLLRKDNTFREKSADRLRYTRTLRFFPGDVYRGYKLMNANNGF